ncbi:uncharacterized protein LOC115920128 isoform X2 [Strongylocentrotus purpuratus]|uniref:Uncharacterized protein n=1 Tax=Strongylocentrotus purpuratus TaxID=7668 RepID=A0A7M7N4M7_STRPU|nr:uncharacterized protein LOC115920128 isoform X2 [Strongylocentrotus purpuratus]
MENLAYSADLLASATQQTGQGICLRSSTTWHTRTGPTRLMNKAIQNMLQYGQSVPTTTWPGRRRSPRPTPTRMYKDSSVRYWNAENRTKDHCSRRLFCSLMTLDTQGSGLHHFLHHKLM